jgi:two-component system chemotaxis response regulator CheY
MTRTRCVLVVDDDDSIREMIELALSSEGYEVVTAPDGAAALALLPRMHPELVLLDMKMPLMDGWEFARRYRQLPDPKPPIVVLTAAQDAARRAIEVGATAYLAKPFAIDQLLDLVHRYGSGT